LLGTQVEEMNEGGDLMYLLMDDENVVGRFNLVVNGKSAEVGYRISARYLGEGCATFGLGELIQQAKSYGIEKLVAVTTFENIASTVVLKKLNFVKVGEQREAAELHGKKVDLIEFERVL
jgi:ribosomal-protein-alanine N-acetyltransferase